MTSRQVANPDFVAGNVIDFESQLDGKTGMIGSGLADLLRIFVHVAKRHAPVIEVIARHRRVLGKADLGNAEFNRPRGVFSRLARRVVAQRGVHVVVRGQGHVSYVECRRSRVECRTKTPVGMRGPRDWGSGGSGSFELFSMLARMNRAALGTGGRM